MQYLHSDMRRWLFACYLHNWYIFGLFFSKGSENNDEQRKWKGAFTFVQCADTQLGLIDKYFHDVKDDEKVTWSRELKYLNMAIDAINALEPKPKFMIIW